VKFVNGIVTFQHGPGSNRARVFLALSCLVQGRQHREVEAVEALHGRELRRLDAALDYAPLAIELLKCGRWDPSAGTHGRGAH